MKTLKISMYIIAVLAVVFSSSCQECVPPVLSENIVGSWSTTEGEVEFKADGTLVDPDDAIIGGETNGVPFTLKSYAVDNDSSTLTVAAYAADSVGFVRSVFDVTDIECDKITFNVFFIPVELKRN